MGAVSFVHELSLFPLSFYPASRVFVSSAAMGLPILPLTIILDIGCFVHAVTAVLAVLELPLIAPTSLERVYAASLEHPGHKVTFVNVSRGQCVRTFTMWFAVH